VPEFSSKKETTSMAKTVLVPPLPNGEITAAARESLKGFFGKCALIAFALFIAEALITFSVESTPMQGAAKHLILGTVTVLFSGLLGMAYFKFCGKIADQEEDPDFKTCIEFSWKRFVIATIAGWFAGLITFLKFFLLIVPGILAALDYAMVPYIAFDNPDIKIGDTLKLSRRLMYGHRWQYFCFGWRFIGWGLLCLLTLGIGFFWLIPYAATSHWKFYRSITPAPESPEAAELPELKPYSGMSVGWRIFWLVILILCSALKDAADERKIERFADAIVKATEIEEEKAAPADNETPQTAPVKQQ
jgi:uncharacterized membrane protein